MTERTKNILWYGTVIPSVLILFAFNPLAGFMFCIGLTVGSIMEVTGFNRSHLCNKCYDYESRCQCIKLDGREGYTNQS